MTGNCWADFRYCKHSLQELVPLLNRPWLPAAESLGFLPVQTVQAYVSACTLATAAYVLSWSQYAVGSETNRPEIADGIVCVCSHAAISCWSDKQHEGEFTRRYCHSSSRYSVLRASVHAHRGRCFHVCLCTWGTVLHNLVSKWMFAAVHTAYKTTNLHSYCFLIVCFRNQWFALWA